MGCCCNTFPTRINADGQLEISYDDGATWVPYPQGDPRQNATLFPPLPGDDGDDKKCQAAANVTGNFHNEIDKTIANTAAWDSLFGLVAAIVEVLVFVGIIGSGGALTPLLV